MARTAIKVKCERLLKAREMVRLGEPVPKNLQKFTKNSVRAYNRCKLCGRARAYYRKFKVCRVCFRGLASEGKIPGVKKASW